MARFRQDIIIILFAIFCYVDAWVIHADHGGNDDKRSARARPKQESKDANARSSLRTFNAIRGVRSKRDNVHSEANVHSLLSETNSLASAAESIQAAENSMAAGIEAEKSRKAFPSRVAKSAAPSPPEPKVREFIPDDHRGNYDDYLDDYYDYGYDYYDPPSYRQTQFRSNKQQNQNRRLSLTANRNKNAQKHLASSPSQNLNNYNTQQEVKVKSSDSSTSNLRSNSVQQKQSSPLDKYDIDLKKVFWLKLPDKLSDQTVHHNVDVLFGEVNREGKDVLVIPISREFTSSEDISEGFMKALGLRALRRARRFRQMKMD